MIDWNRNGRLDPVDVGISASAEQDREDGTITICTYPFSFIQELQPQRDLIGRIKQYAPAKNAEVPLNKYGGGTFCRFSLTGGNFWGAKGVYALFDTQGLLYVGQTINLSQRFNSGYGNISKRNCYADGQSTNCKINSMILRKYLSGERVFLYFCESRNHESIEQELLETLRPPFNSTSMWKATRQEHDREKIIKKEVTEMEQDFELAWEKIKRCEGEEFCTVTGKKFTYRMMGNSVVPTHTNYPLAKSNFEKAFRIKDLNGPGQISATLRGSSYVYAIITDARIR